MYTRFISTLGTLVTKDQSSGSVTAVDFPLWGTLHSCVFLALPGELYSN